MEKIRQFDRHVIIASTITGFLMLLVGGVLSIFSGHEDSSINMPHPGALILIIAVFAVITTLILQILNKRIPMFGVVGLVVLIIVVVLERFILMRMIRVDLALVFFAYLNFSWLMLLGLNTWLSVSDKLDE